VIDDTSRGADGVRLADVNGDGFADIATGWEQGGVIRVYLNPGPFAARQRWPSVTVGRVGSPEDAVFTDLDADGAVDVVSSCEGDERSIFVHWAPRDARDYGTADAWRTEALPAAKGAMRWMFALPLEVDYRRGIDLVAGAKGPGAEIGWFEAPAETRRLDRWKWHPMYAAGWVMSLMARDMDADGDIDILASDRTGDNRGTLWLENPGPGPAQRQRWPEHRIGATGEEVMFLTEADLDRDGLTDVVAAVKPRRIFFHRRLGRDGLQWEEFVIPIPEAAGTAKAVAVGDIDMDGALDLVFSCERAHEGLSGIMWLSRRGRVSDPDWTPHDISGGEGVKYDLVELIDLDGDGDLDVLSCEESTDLGVIWYENPAR
jgi:hypothetical protein